MSKLEELEVLIKDQLDGLGYELVDLRFLGSKQIQVMVDGPGGITVGDCEAISHELTPILDDDQWALGNYSLEVSSPGLNRPLKKRADFEKFCGKKVAIQTHHTHAGRRNYRGILKSVETDGVCVEVERDEYRIPFDEIRKAHVVYEFEPQLKLVK